MPRCVPDAPALVDLWKGCTARYGWLESLLERQPSLFTPRPVLVNVGANKGYAAPHFLSLTSQNRGGSVAAWRQALHEVAHGKIGLAGQAPMQHGFLAMQLCGACMQCVASRPKKHGRDGGTVHLLELTKQNSELLRHVANATGVGDMVHVHNVAASNVSALVHSPSVKLGTEIASVLHPLNWRIRKHVSDVVEQLSMDEFFEREGLRGTIDVVEIDTEGHDPKVLQGMRGALSQRRVTLLEFEYSGRWAGDQSLEQSLALLAGAGYGCFMEAKRSGKEVLAPISPPCWHAAFEMRAWSNVVCSHDPRALSLLEADAWAAYATRSRAATNVSSSLVSAGLTDRSESDG